MSISVVPFDFKLTEGMLSDHETRFSMGAFALRVI